MYQYSPMLVFHVLSLESIMKMLVILELMFCCIANILVLWLDCMFLIGIRNFLYFGKCPIFRGNSARFIGNSWVRLAGE